MQIPIYQARVGPAQPSPVQQPATDTSAYEGVIQFSDALKRVGGQVAQIALDNERRVRRQTMQAEASRAWRDYSQFKSDFHAQYFDPQQANKIDEDTGLPMYVLGLQRMPEKASEFLNKATEGFTYSEALQGFQENYEQDMVEFNRRIRQESRALHLAALQHELGEGVEDAARRGDADRVRELLDGAQENGIISPQQRSDIGNARLHDMKFREVVQMLRQNIWEGTAPADLNELMEIVATHGLEEYEDMDGESRRLTVEDLENLRNLGRQERSARIQDEAWQRGEADRISNEHAQRDFRDVMNGEIPLSQMFMKLREADQAMGQLDEEHEYVGMSAQTREYWHRQITALEAARNDPGRTEQDNHHVFANVYRRIFEGADRTAIDELILNYFEDEQLTETQYRTLTNFNHSRNLNDQLSEMTRLIQTEGRLQGRSPREIMAAEYRMRDMLRENAMIRQTEDGEWVMVEGYGRDDVMTIAENLLRNPDWAGWADRQLGPEMAGGIWRDTFQRFNVGHEVQIAIDEQYLLGHEWQSDPEVIRVLNQQAAYQGRDLQSELNLPDQSNISSTFDDEDGRVIFTLQTGRRGGPEYRRFTYFADPEYRDDGTLRRATSTLHLLGADGRWHPVDDAGITALQSILGTTPQGRPPRPQPTAEERVENLSQAATRQREAQLQAAREAAERRKAEEAEERRKAEEAGRATGTLETARSGL